MPFENLSSIPPKAPHEDVAESLSFHMDTSTIKGSQRYEMFDDGDESPDLGSVSERHSTKNANFEKIEYGVTDNNHHYPVYTK